MSLFSAGFERDFGICLKNVRDFGIEEKAGLGFGWKTMRDFGIYTKNGRDFGIQMTNGIGIEKKTMSGFGICAKT